MTGPGLERLMPGDAEFRRKDAKLQLARQVGEILHPSLSAIGSFVFSPSSPLAYERVDIFPAGTNTAALHPKNGLMRAATIMRRFQPKPLLTLYGEASQGAVINDEDLMLAVLFKRMGELKGGRHVKNTGDGRLALMHFPLDGWTLGNSEGVENVVNMLRARSVPHFATTEDFEGITHQHQFWQQFRRTE